MTGQRRVIARVLSDAADHPDVEEVYRRAAALDARMSIATVYRTVRLFEEKGILERRDFGGGRARYEPTEHGKHHEQLIEAIASRLGFDLMSYRLELFGRKAAQPMATAEARPRASGKRGPAPPPRPGEVP